MSNTADNLTGKTLGTSILEKLIGQGGMGAVYLAKQIRPSRFVAIKVLLPNITPNSSLYKEFLTRFRRITKPTTASPAENANNGLSNGSPPDWPGKKPRPWKDVMLNTRASFQFNTWPVIVPKTT